MDDTAAKLRFYISLTIALALGGLRLMGVITNIWLGSVMLLAAFGLIAYAFLVVQNRGPMLCRWLSVCLGGLLLLTLGGWQSVRQYRLEHPDVQALNLQLSTNWIAAPLAFGVLTIVLLLVWTVRRSSVKESEQPKSANAAWEEEKYFH